jgi:Rrf2 family nitric oxide-sensitive transcriptional repressor
MLSQTAEYALRTIVWLASQTPDESFTNHKIANGTQVPAGYLAKVMQALRHAGLVRSHRGPYGSFTLTRLPEQITMLDVINAVEPIQRIDTCPLGLEFHGKELCPLHRRLDQTAALIEDAFSKTTVAELLNTPSRSKPLCEITVEGRR